MAVAENVQKIRTYFLEAQTEAKRVIWPSRQYVIAATLVVLFIIGVVILFVMGVDTVLSILFDFLVKAF